MGCIREWCMGNAWLYGRCEPRDNARLMYRCMWAAFSVWFAVLELGCIRRYSAGGAIQHGSARRVGRGRGQSGRSSC